MKQGSNQAWPTWEPTGYVEHCDWTPLSLFSTGAEEEMTNKAEAEEETFQLPISPAADDISSAGRNPSPALMDCGVYLPGLRHGGKALVVAELALLQEEKNKAVTATDLARLLAHYRSSLVPRKSASKNGLVLLVVGRPEEFPEAFQLIRQLLHYIQNVWRFKKLRVLGP